MNGRLFRGDRPGAGEIGHVRVVDDGLPCSCGNHGCLETVASVPSILRMAASRAGVETIDPLDLPWDVGKLSESFGEGPIHEAVTEAGHRLGGVLANLVAILDVHQIVIALELEGAEDALLDAVRQEVQARVLPSLASVVEFTPSKRGSDLVLAGAAAMVLREQLGVVWR